MQKIQWSTAVVVVAGVAGLVTASILGVDKETIVAIGSALLALAGAMRSFMGNDEKPPPPPDGPTSGTWPIAVVLVALMPSLSGCAFLEKHAKDALSVAQIACIIANQTAPDSKVAEICDVADDYFEPMQKVLTDARRASDKAAADAAESTRAAHCGRDREP